ncbi:hypothetical protein Trydic_g1843 [Trypoxylus dichotomus]
MWSQSEIPDSHKRIWLKSRSSWTPRTSKSIEEQSNEQDVPTVPYPTQQPTQSKDGHNVLQKTNSPDPNLRQLLVGPQPGAKLLPAP